MAASRKGYARAGGCVDRVLQDTTPSGPETLMVAIDVSGSMSFDDWSPTRLRGAQDAFDALLAKKRNERPHDYVGLVSFAFIARLRSGPVEVGVQSDILHGMARKMRASGGTNIRAALEKAGNALNSTIPASQSTTRKGVWGWLSSWVFSDRDTIVSRPPPSTLRRIILLTDGHHNTGRGPVALSKRLKEDGIEINCIGIGGAPSDVDEAQLRKIASRGPEGNPRYWFIGDRTTLIKKFESLATGLRSISP